MFRGKQRRFTSAHAIAIAALFFALGGGAYAAVSSLPPNSVGTKQLQNGSVTEAKLALGASPKLTAKQKRELVKIIKRYTPKPGVRETGPAGPPGSKGEKGDAGPAGPSDVYIGGAAGGSLSSTLTEIASISVPAGDYLLQAKTEIFSVNLGEGGDGSCSIVPSLGGEAWDAGSAAFPGISGQFSAGSLALAGAASLPSGGEVILACRSLQGSLSVDDARVWASKVGSLHGLPVPID